MFHGLKPGEGKHHPDYKSLVDAATAGCYLCGPILQKLRKETGTFETSTFDYVVCQPPGNMRI
jgi:hypothetical protein